MFEIFIELFIYKYLMVKLSITLIVNTKKIKVSQMLQIPKKCKHFINTFFRLFS